MTFLKKTWLPVLPLAALLALALPACASAGTTPAPSPAVTDPDALSNAAPAQPVAPGGSLVIPVSELSDAVRFYPATVDGVTMEVLAVKTGDGKLRTAFNTCQVCNGSPYAYFEQRGDKVECQNCGNQFPMNRIEAEAGGCNPWPIFPDQKTETDAEIRIGYEFLSANAPIFSSWKEGIQ
ncbi:MAG: DUF2318 domain-containing protein [Oscillospiraceae bacterium]|jgi:uncharacterized membrane protein|nr:DUF2318 domain-containing protein [Oscillospiraceae bacterium]